MCTGISETARQFDARKVSVDERDMRHEPMSRQTRWTALKGGGGCLNSVFWAETCYSVTFAFRHFAVSGSTCWNSLYSSLNHHPCNLNSPGDNWRSRR